MWQFLQLTITLVLTVTSVHGFGGGAPASHCGPGNIMVPGHGGIAAQPANTNPYTLSAGQTTYTTGDTVTLILGGGSNFRGFLVQAESSGAVVGTMVPISDARTLNCGGTANGLTHVSKADKDSLSFNWQAPNVPGTVTFYVTIVETYTAYWTRQPLLTLTISDDSGPAITTTDAAATTADGETPQTPLPQTTAFVSSTASPPLTTTPSSSQVTTNQSVNSKIGDVTHDVIKNESTKGTVYRVNAFSTISARVPLNSESNTIDASPTISAKVPLDVHPNTFGSFPTLSENAPLGTDLNMVDNIGIHEEIKNNNVTELNVEHAHVLSALNVVDNVSNINVLNENISPPTFINQHNQVDSALWPEANANTSQTNVNDLLEIFKTFDQSTTRSTEQKLSLNPLQTTTSLRSQWNQHKQVEVHAQTNPEPPTPVSDFSLNTIDGISGPDAFFNTLSGGVNEGNVVDLYHSNHVELPADIADYTKWLDNAASSTTKVYEPIVTPSASIGEAQGEVIDSFIENNTARENNPSQPTRVTLVTNTAEEDTSTPKSGHMVTNSTESNVINTTMFVETTSTESQTPQPTTTISVETVATTTRSSLNMANVSEKREHVHDIPEPILPTVLKSLFTKSVSPTVADGKNTNAVNKADEHYGNTKSGQIAYDNDCGMTKGCFVKCSGNDCEYMVTWRDLGNEVQFEIFGKPENAFQNAWVAVGFSDDTKMGQDSVTECVFSNGMIRAFNSFNPGYSNRRLTNQVGLSNVQGSYFNGVLACTFTRTKSVPQIPEMFDLNQDWHIMYANGRVNQLPAWQLYMHSTENLPPASASKVDYQSMAVIGSVAKNKLVKAHGCLMILAWVLFTGIGIVSARYYKNVWGDKTFLKLKIWFQIHRACMVSAVVLDVIAFVIIFIEVKGYSEIPSIPGKEYLQSHPVIGIIVTLLCLANPVMALFRPGGDHKRRPIFNWAHWGVGMSAYILSAICICFGFKLGKSSTPDYAVYIMIVYVLYVILFDVVFEVMECMSKRERKAKVEGIEMSNKNGTDNGHIANGNNMSKETQRKNDKVKTMLLAIHIAFTGAFALVLVLVVALN